MDETRETQNVPSGDTPTVTAPVADVVAPVVVPDVVTDSVSADAVPAVAETPLVTEPAQPKPEEEVSVPIVSDIVLEPVSTEPTPTLESVTIEPTPELPTIQVDTTPPTSVSSSTPTIPEHEVRIVERVVEKVVERVVEKEVVKEVPVEKIVEKVVYRDPEPTVCPPLTQEEREAIKRDFLIELSHEGTARKHALVAEKLETILALFETRERIMHKDVMDALDCSSTTATRLLTELRHEGKLLLHGTGGNSAIYTKI